MFSQEDFINASRQFVCVRLESYESEEHQKIVRSFLNGRFENTAFCLLAPDGKERLSRSGRAPWMAFSPRRGPRGEGGDAEMKTTLDAMEKVAKKSRTKGALSKPVVQDFHSFKQSLNVASGDQRLLLYAAVKENQQGALKKTLSRVFGDKQIIGRFHSDFFSADTDEDWAKSVEGEKSKQGLLIIQSDKFGQHGKVLKQLPATASTKEIKTALLEANQAFAKSEQRKVYKDHVSDGRRQHIEFENAMPYGEDRDGDGKIDHRGGRGSRRSPKGER